MNKTIKISSFDVSELNELRDILEKYQIKEINNNIKFKDEIEIEYDDKERIILNEKFNFKVKSIRNKYYRQLLNIINIIDPKGAYAASFDGFGNRIYLDDHIDVSNYKNILKMALINYIGVYNFDNIFELTKDEMLELRKYKYGADNINNDKEHAFDVLGMYCHNSERLFSILESKIDEHKLDEMKKCNRFILICPELIQEFCVENFDKFKKCEIRDIFELYNIIFNKVLVHEIGHGVFDYTSDLHDDKGESRANYFASLTFDGTFDQIIKVQTNIPRGLYENPKLITDDISTITKFVYNI